MSRGFGFDGGLHRYLGEHFAEKRAAEAKAAAEREAAEREKAQQDAADLLKAVRDFYAGAVGTIPVDQQIWGGDDLIIAPLKPLPDDAAATFARVIVGVREGAISANEGRRRVASLARYYRIDLPPMPRDELDRDAIDWLDRRSA